MQYTSLPSLACRGQVHKDTMERLNGEVRDREKVMRELKRTDTPILKGAQIFHNYIKPPEGLDGRTPAEVAGIVVKGEDEWKT
jgi:putative transposase